MDLVRIEEQTAILTSISTTQRITQWGSRVRGKLEWGEFEKGLWAGKGRAAQRLEGWESLQVTEVPGG